MLGSGDVLTTLEAGGGGFGDPKARDKAAVIRDVDLGFVTAAGADRDYGVRV